LRGKRSNGGESGSVGEGPRLFCKGLGAVLGSRECCPAFLATTGGRFVVYLEIRGEIDFVASNDNVEMPLNK